MTSGIAADASTPLDVTPKLRAFTKNSAVAVPVKLTGVKVNRSAQRDAEVTPVPRTRQAGRWQSRKPVPSGGATDRYAGAASAGGPGMPARSTTETFISATAGETWTTE